MTQPVITLPVVWQSNISIKVWEIFCSNTHLKDYNVLDFLYFEAINPTSLKWVRTCHPLLFSHCLRHGFCFESEDVNGNRVNSGFGLSIQTIWMVFVTNKCKTCPLLFNCLLSLLFPTCNHSVTVKLGSRIEIQDSILLKVTYWQLTYEKWFCELSIIETY